MRNNWILWLPACLLVACVGLCSHTVRAEDGGDSAGGDADEAKQAQDEEHQEMEQTKKLDYTVGVVSLEGKVTLQQGFDPKNVQPNTPIGTLDAKGKQYTLKLQFAA